MKKIVQAAAFAEKFILPLVYFYFAWAILQNIDPWNRTGLWSTPLSRDDIVVLIRDTFLFIMQFTIGLTLLTNRKPAVPPQNLKEVLVPLLASFFFITYDLVPYLPEVWRSSPLPAHLQEPFSEAGLLIGAIGPVISAWGVVSLGRSFAILVSVRKVVFHGTYKYVRHPIYLGYFFLFGGIVLDFPAPAYLVLFPIHFIIMAWRARLEEASLSKFSTEYREHMAHTGFFFPRFWRADKAISKP